MESILNVLQEIVETSGFAALVSAGGWKNLIMIALACVLLYLGIGKKFEPLLLVGIAFGMLLTNLPGAGLISSGALGRDHRRQQGLWRCAHRGRPAGYSVHRRQNGVVSISDFPGRWRHDRFWAAVGQSQKPAAGLSGTAGCLLRVPAGHCPGL